MQEGAATRLRDDVQVGTSRRQARTVRNAYDTPEGAAGRTLGQSNRVLIGDLAARPKRRCARRWECRGDSVGRQLAQNLGDEPADAALAAARAQDESAQALAAASNKAQGGQRRQRRRGNSRAGDRWPSSVLVHDDEGRRNSQIARYDLYP
jgi:hypothetical protein